MIVATDTEDGAPLEFHGRAAAMVRLIAARLDRINVLPVGRITFHVTARRVVLEVAEAAVAEALVPK